MNQSAEESVTPSEQEGLSPGARRGFRFLQFGLLAVLLGALLWASRPTETPAEPLPVRGKVPHFSLTEAAGGTLTLSDLSGRVWIADFIFTRCGGQCLDITKRMHDLQEALRSDANVRFVSLTVDPGYDTIERLNDYAERHKADRTRWYFATGSKEDMHELIRNGFKVPAEATDDEEQAAGADLFMHSARFVLVDGTGHIRGYYSSDDSADLHRLVDDARQLARGPAA